MVKDLSKLRLASLGDECAVIGEYRGQEGSAHRIFWPDTAESVIVYCREPVNPIPAGVRVFVGYRIQYAPSRQFRGNSTPPSTRLDCIGIQPCEVPGQKTIPFNRATPPAAKE